MQEASLSGYYTNHSLRVTTATRMYRKNCPEQLIPEFTGHRGLAIRGYKKKNQNHKNVMYF